MHEVSCLVVLDDGARARYRSSGVDVVAVFNEYVVAGNRNRIQTADAVRGAAECLDGIDMRLWRRIRVGHEDHAVSRRKVYVAGIRGGNERRKDARGRIDLAEGLQASDRSGIVVGVEARRMKRIGFVG